MTGGGWQVAASADDGVINSHGVVGSWNVRSVGSFELHCTIGVKWEHEGRDSRKRAWCKRGGGGCELASTKRASHVKGYAVPATSGPAARAVPNTTLLATTVRVSDPRFALVADTAPEVAPK